MQAISHSALHNFHREKYRQRPAPNHCPDHSPSPPPDCCKSSPAHYPPASGKPPQKRHPHTPAPDPVFPPWRSAPPVQNCPSPSPGSLLTLPPAQNAGHCQYTSGSLAFGPGSSPPPPPPAGHIHPKVDGSAQNNTGPDSPQTLICPAIPSHGQAPA